MVRITRWARSYCAAVMLNLAIVGDIPTRPTRPAIGFEREFAADLDGFDPRERVGDRVITVPLDLAGRHRTNRCPN